MRVFSLIASTYLSCSRKAFGANGRAFPPRDSKPILTFALLSIDSHKGFTAWSCSNRCPHNSSEILQRLELSGERDIRL